MVEDLLRRGTRGPGRRRGRWSPPRERRRRRARGRRAVVLLVGLLVVGCGARRPADVRSEPPREGAAEADRATEEADASEAGRLPSDPGAGTPERRASEHLVREGVTALEAGNAALAARRLEEAIRLDGSNGEAWYQLARVRATEGRQDAALGLLERAIELLRPYPERQAAAERLRERLSSG